MYNMDHKKMIKLKVPVCPFIVIIFFKLANSSLYRVAQ